MEENNKRKFFTPDQKFKIVKEHLTTKTPISELAQKYGFSTPSFYDWQEKFFQGAQAVFSQKKEALSKEEQRKILELESQNDRMKNVIAEITAENIDLKKTSGPYLRQG